MKRVWVITRNCIKRNFNMIINHPILGPRDSSEFTYIGDSALIDRPDWQAQDALAQRQEVAASYTDRDQADVGAEKHLRLPEEVQARHRSLGDLE